MTKKMIKNIPLKVGILPVILLLGLGIFSCKKDSSNDNSTSGDLVAVPDSIAVNTTLTANHKYLLKKWVYVKDGATLTIEAGTVIRGDKDTKAALIVEPGGKIMAQGTVDKPIIFTSNQPIHSRSYGDWGGVILCGKAPVNAVNPTVEGGVRTHYGGTDAHDNSGIMQYVRIEFAGIAFKPDNEINGLTFAGVGDGTTIDHIQVSYSGDDSYEWFGGTVNCKYLIAHRGWDDDFDTDNGFSGKVQFAVGLRSPADADASGSKGMESDNDGAGDALTPQTMCVFSNVTLVGPVKNIASIDYNSNYVAGVHIRRNSSLSLFNSVVMGFPAGILIDDPAKSSGGSTSTNIKNGTCEIKNTIVAGIPTGPITGSTEKYIVYVYNGAGSLTSTTTMGDSITNGAFGTTFNGPITWFNTPAFTNKVYATVGDVRLQSPFDLTNPNFIPTTTSPIVNSQYKNDAGTTVWHDPAVPVVASSYVDAKVSDSFFTKVNYIGAFAGTQTTSDNWTAGWSNFDPNNTDY
jgi:hypothetical protein